MSIIARYGADLAALLVVCVWGVSFSLQKLALEEVPPLPFTCLRYVGMLALGWGVVLWQRWRGGASLRISRADLPLFALAGMLGYSLYIVLSTVALSHTTAFPNSLLIGTAPLFSVGLLHWLGLERIGLVHWLGMLAAMLGVGVLLSEKLAGGGGMAGLGDLVSLAGALCFAGYSVANKPLLARYPLGPFMALTLTLGGVPVVLLTAPGLFGVDWAAVSGPTWLALAWTVVVPVYVAWAIWGWAIARVGLARTATYMYVVPVVGGLTSWLLLNESFGSAKLAGAALILAGLVAARGRQAVHAGAPPPTILRNPVTTVRPGTHSTAEREPAQNIGVTSR